jgi:predicted RNase H-like HicB family nuclease
MKSLYIGLVHKDPDSCYGMSFPDAPGCFSAADAASEIYPMAREALSLWLDGMIEDRLPLPAVRTVEEIKHDPDWSESLRDAAFVIGVEVELPMQTAA